MNIEEIRKIGEGRGYVSPEAILKSKDDFQIVKSCVLDYLRYDRIPLGHVKKYLKTAPPEDVLSLWKAGKENALMFFSGMFQIKTKGQISKIQEKRKKEEEEKRRVERALVKDKEDTGQLSLFE